MIRVYVEIRDEDGNMLANQQAFTPEMFEQKRYRRASVANLVDETVSAWEAKYAHQQQG